MKILIHQPDGTRYSVTEQHIERRDLEMGYDVQLHADNGDMVGVSLELYDDTLQAIVWALDHWSEGPQVIPLIKNFSEQAKDW